MLGGSNTTRTHIDPARVGFGVVDEFGHRARWKRRVHLHEVGKPDQAGNRRKVPDEIETWMFVERHVDGIDGAGEEKRVAVGRSGNDRGRGQVGAGARTVLDHDWLAQPVREPLPDQARGDVEGSAGRKTDADTDGSRWIRP